MDILRAKKLNVWLTEDGFPHQLGYQISLKQVVFFLACQFSQRSFAVVSMFYGLMFLIDNAISSRPYLHQNYSSTWLKY